MMQTPTPAFLCHHLPSPCQSFLDPPCSDQSIAGVFWPFSKFYDAHGLGRSRIISAPMFVYCDYRLRCGVNQLCGWRSHSEARPTCSGIGLRPTGGIADSQQRPLRAVVESRICEMHLQPPSKTNHHAQASSTKPLKVLPDCFHIMVLITFVAPFISVYSHRSANSLNLFF